jgi:hypothetical protein
MTGCRVTASTDAASAAAVVTEIASTRTGVEEAAGGGNSERVRAGVSSEPLALLLLL